MNDRPKPIQLERPDFLERGRATGAIPRASPKEIAERSALAEALRAQIAPLSARARRLTDAQRRAFFVKLTHDGAINLTGTGLRPFSPPDSNVTLAVLRHQDLTQLDDKVRDYGEGPIRDRIIPSSSLVSRLDSVSEGQPLDRLSDDLIDDYDQLTARASLVLEVELTSLKAGRNQQRLELGQIREELDALLGRGIHGNIFEHEDDRSVCRVVLRCTGAIFKELVEQRRWQTRISWFEGRPKFETFHATLRDFALADLQPIGEPPEDAPIVCVIDSGVLPGNPFLAPVTRDELLKSFLKGREADLYDETGHGSGVASLVSYYLLNVAPQGANTPRAIIASARILDGDDDCPERLFSAVLREAVASFKPLGVKIFNLSINQYHRPWNAATRRLHPRRSWVARTIDQLSRSDDVVFVVSTGNISRGTIKTLHTAAPFPKYFSDDATSILDPGQAALAITVGSLAASTQMVGNPANLSALAAVDQPSPFTRKGPGIRGEVKPELLEYGGNLAIDAIFGSIVENQGCGVVVASNRISPPISHNHGTSLAAPKVSHRLANVLANVRTMGLEPSACLLKALLVSSAEYPQSRDLLEAIHELNEAGVDYRQVLGYGVSDDVRATYCDDFSVVMYYQGHLPHDKVALFSIPVPSELERAQGRKQLSVCVAFHPEVHYRGFGDYFGSTLVWRLFRGDQPHDQIVASLSEPDSEEVQEENAGAEEDDQADDEDTDAPLADRPLREMIGAHRVTMRSKGAVQFDVFSWSRHNKRYSAADYILAVTSFERWNRTNPPDLPFAVVVRLEEQSRTVPIYNAVQVGVRVPVRVPAV